MVCDYWLIDYLIKKQLVEKIRDFFIMVRGCLFIFLKVDRY